MDRAVLAELSRTGLLLQSDPVLPSVSGIVSGEKIHGSWWGHKNGHEIFTVLNHLNAHPDAIITRLVSGKVTYLHRRLWPDFLALATSEDEWQTEGLSRAARQLYRLVQNRGEVRMDRVVSKRNVTGLSKAAREIEGRLLVYSDEIHTETGAHAKVLMNWSRCPKLEGFRSRGKSPAPARRTFEVLIASLNREHHARATLPWSAKSPMVSTSARRPERQPTSEVASP